MDVLSHVVRHLLPESPSDIYYRCLAEYVYSPSTTAVDTAIALFSTVLSFVLIEMFTNNSIMTCSTYTSTMSYLTTLIFFLVLCVITATVCASRANSFQLWPPPPLRNNSNKPKESTTETSRSHPGDPIQDDADVAVDGKNDTIASSSSPSSYFVIPWWEDLFQLEDDLDDVQTTTKATSDDPNDSSNKNAPTQVLHFCFLVHGHRGYSKDLSYLQRKMKSLGEQEKEKRRDPMQQQSEPPMLVHDMIVHCASCNERKTMDGVQKGGERLVEEILEVIRGELERRGGEAQEHIQDITISVVGNSLGGVYGRYAIAKLAQACEANDDDTCDPDGCLRLDGRYRMHFNIFCSTAAPHLGISKHTYVPLPRSAEIGVANVLGDTGRDLFRLNDLLKDMATSPAFLDPLRSFRKRVAYANAYFTDFPVPASTAAFLSDSSTYPHHFVDDGDVDHQGPNIDPVLDSEEPDGRGGLVIATLRTHPSQPDKFMAANAAASKNNNSDANETSSSSSSMDDDLVLMSASLDSLGWKKVFIDLRKEIPLRVALPSSRKLKKSISNGLLAASSLGKDLNNVTALLFSSSDVASERSSPDKNKEEEEQSNGGSSSDDGEKSALLSLAEQLAASAEKTPSPIEQLRQKGVVESRDLVSAVSSPGDNRISFPIGHNLMVAMSRDRFSSWTHKKGRPVMDILAKELVKDIFAWDVGHDNTLQTTSDLKTAIRSHHQEQM